MWLLCSCVQKSYSHNVLPALPLSLSLFPFFSPLLLHVCSTCSSHISTNIYTGCKTLLISLPCLLSCSFSGPTLAMTFFRADWEWQGGGDRKSERAEREQVEWGQDEESETEDHSEERKKTMGPHSFCFLWKLNKRKSCFWTLVIIFTVIWEFVELFS